ncbi:MAG: hypothetical protein SNJ72_04505 [Fimbriimonadales bacterium]
MGILYLYRNRLQTGMRRLAWGLFFLVAYTAHLVARRPVVLPIEIVSDIIQFAIWMAFGFWLGRGIYQLFYFLATTEVETLLEPFRRR